MKYYDDPIERKRFAIIPEPPDYRGAEKNTEREQKRNLRQRGIVADAPSEEQT
jgi:hypothetical protein